MTQPRELLFEPTRAFETLNRHGVKYVVIGGLAAAAHGSPSVTRDTDICYARDRANLEALAAALAELHARLRGVEREVSFRLDAKTLAAGDSFAFTTDVGSLDILATPSGTTGYDELEASAESVEIGSETVRIASIDELLRMKRAAARPKDMVEVEILSALKDEIENPPRNRR
jgi:hypothetical protein